MKENELKFKSKKVDKNFRHVQIINFLGAVSFCRNQNSPFNLYCLTLSITSHVLNITQFTHHGLWILNLTLHLGHNVRNDDIFDNNVRDYTILEIISRMKLSWRWNLGQQQLEWQPLGRRTFGMTTSWMSLSVIVMVIYANGEKSGKNVIIKTSHSQLET